MTKRRYSRALIGLALLMGVAGGRPASAADLGPADDLGPTEDLADEDAALVGIQPSMTPSRFACSVGHAPLSAPWGGMALLLGGAALLRRGRRRPCARS